MRRIGTFFLGLTLIALTTLTVMPHLETADGADTDHKRLGMAHLSENSHGLNDTHPDHEKDSFPCVHCLPAFSESEENSMQSHGFFVGNISSVTCETKRKTDFRQSRVIYKNERIFLLTGHLLI